MYFNIPKFRFSIDDYCLIIALGSVSFATCNSIPVDDCTFYGNTTISIGKFQFHIQSREYVSIA